MIKILITLDENWYDKDIILKVLREEFKDEFEFTFKHDVSLGYPDISYLNPSILNKIWKDVNIDEITKTNKIMSVIFKKIKWFENNGKK